MKIKFLEIENAIEFRQGMISVLEINNKSLFKNMIMKLYQITQGMDNDFAINIVDGDEINNLKNFELVTDIFSIDESDINNKLVKYLNNELENSEYKKEIFEILEELKSKFLNYFDDIPFEMCYNYDISIIDLLKDFAPKLNNQKDFSYLKMLNNYIKAIKMLKITDLIVFVDIKKYLTKEELVQFYQNAFMLDLSVLLIESNSSEIIDGYEWKLNIDNDLYETIPLEL